MLHYLDSGMQSWISIGIFFVSQFQVKEIFRFANIIIQSFLTQNYLLVTYNKALYNILFMAYYMADKYKIYFRIYEGHPVF